MGSMGRIHREMGQLGHLGEFFFALGLFIFAGGIAILFWGRTAMTGASAVDAATAGWLFLVAGAGVMVFGTYTMFSGWGRHHPRFEHGGDPDVPDSYSYDGE